VISARSGKEVPVLRSSSDATATHSTMVCWKEYFVLPDDGELVPAVKRSVTAAVTKGCHSDAFSRGNLSVYMLKVT
jgi:hypothetical protein